MLLPHKSLGLQARICSISVHSGDAGSGKYKNPYLWEIDAFMHKAAAAEDCILWQATTSPCVMRTHYSAHICKYTGSVELKE